MMISTTTKKPIYIPSKYKSPFNLFTLFEKKEEFVYKAHSLRAKFQAKKKTQTKTKAKSSKFVYLLVGLLSISKVCLSNRVFIWGKNYTTWSYMTKKQNAICRSCICICICIRIYIYIATEMFVCVYAFNFVHTPYFFCFTFFLLLLQSSRLININYLLKNFMKKYISFSNSE